MGVTSCMSMRPVARSQSCHCPACPRGLGQQPQTIVLPPIASEHRDLSQNRDKKSGKMKLVKKIKKKMGLAARGSNASCGVTTSAGVAPPNNLPPLTFHQTRGENVRISRDGATAKRVESFCKGVAFGARPVRINEKVCIRFSEISNNWSGVLRFGFTSNDPSTLSHALPKYACPDLTNKPGYWAKALAERFCEKDNILHYYVNSTGDVHFGINGEEKGLFFSGVETRGPLWVLLDVYGNCTAVQFVDPRVSNPTCRRSAMQERRAMSPELEDRLSGGLRNMSIEEPLLPLRYNTGTLAPIPLHRIKGRNVRLIPEQGIATRIDTEFTQGYVFTARPLQLGETIIIQILSTEPLYVGSLALGLTSCDPNVLSPMELPEDADSLLDRQEYWVVSKDAAGFPRRGDELSFCVTADGEVKVAKNGGPAETVMHVDHSLRLWAFVDVYGATQKVRILGRPPQQVPTVHHNAPVRSASSVGVRVTPAADGGALLVVNLPPAQNFANHQSQAASAYLEQPIPSSSSYCVPGPVSPPIHHQIQPSSSSTQWMNHQSPSSSSSNNVNIPMCRQQAISSQNHLNGQQMALPPTQLPTIANVQIPINSSQLNSLAQSQMNGQMLANIQNEVSSGRQGSSGVQNQMSAQIAYDSNVSCSRMSEIYSTLGETVTINGPTPGGECTICYENPIDSVLYMCGHMCMCYRCAVQQWRGKGGGQCPLCRAYIRDVIRTYKS